MRTTRLPVIVCAALCIAACDDPRIEQAAESATGGDAARGRTVVATYECGVCHQIPGVRAARGVVGPPLAAFGHRAFIGGMIPNSPGNLVRWVLDPPALDPRTAMPNLGLQEQEARDVAAFLYTLR
jgi:cytochrome c